VNSKQASDQASRDTRPLACVYDGWCSTRAAILRVAVPHVICIVRRLQHA
jgi:hypothetical protein